MKTLFTNQQLANKLSGAKKSNQTRRDDYQLYLIDCVIRTYTNGDTNYLIRLVDSMGSGMAKNKMLLAIQQYTNVKKSEAKKGTNNFFVSNGKRYVFTAKSWKKQDIAKIIKNLRKIKWYEVTPNKSEEKASTWNCETEPFRDVEKYYINTFTRKSNNKSVTVTGNKKIMDARIAMIAELVNSEKFLTITA